MGCFGGKSGDEEERLRKETNKKIERQLQKDKQTYRATHRLLLLGNLFVYWILIGFMICVLLDFSSLEPHTFLLLKVQESRGNLQLSSKWEFFTSMDLVLSKWMFFGIILMLGQMDVIMYTAIEESYS